MCNVPQISDSEWKVMKIVWANKSCTANQVVEVLSENTDWQPQTIRTLINRLVKKGVLNYIVDENDKKTYHYFATVEERQCVKAESQSFLDRVFNGSLKVMMENFVSDSKLSEEDIDELKRILDKKKG
ncbi:MAG: BlaI/MecI/CopY family transcriptional regulator [Bacillota bacterium]|nr:BlaI/MecI/CopY family transcriptional regulator [Bacillota bacterium]